jgi:hypothetical protein
MRRIIMRQRVLIMTLVGLVVTLGSAIVFSTLSPVVSASEEVQKSARGSNDVILMRCATVGSELSVMAWGASSSAPSKRSDNCAEVLSQLLKSGFTIEDIGHNNDAEQVVYTLIR